MRRRVVGIHLCTYECMSTHVCFIMLHYVAHAISVRMQTGWTWKVLDSVFAMSTEACGRVLGELAPLACAVVAIRLFV